MTGRRQAQRLAHRRLLLQQVQRPALAKKKIPVDDDRVPIQGKPVILDGVVCLLASKNYIVTGSLGLDARVTRPFLIRMDTCSGYILIWTEFFPSGWEQLQIDEGEDEHPRLGDANGKRLYIGAAIRLRLRFGNRVYQTKFYAVDRLAVPVLVATAFMNKHVDAIRCRLQRIEFYRGAHIPIVAELEGQAHYLDLPPSPGTDDPNSSPPKTGAAKEGTPRTRETNRSSVVRLAPGVTIPPMSQRTVWVTSDARGISYLEPKHSVQFRHGIRVV